MKAKFCSYGFFNQLQYGCTLHTNYGSFYVIDVNEFNIIVEDDNSEVFEFNLYDFKKGTIFHSN